jgi:methionine-rich copper-binding protein CopC
MKMPLLLFLSIALCSGGSAYAAHAKLMKSTPDDNSVSNTSPPDFVLEFTEAVTPHQVYIKKDDSKQTAVSNLPRNDAKTIKIPVPSLTAGHYVLDWSVFTHDSVVLHGRIRFTVSGESVASLSPKQ